MINHLQELIKLFPNKDWNWDELSDHPNITWKFIKNNPQFPWKIDAYLNHMDKNDIDIDFILNNV
jgi:hypothetical protein